MEPLCMACHDTGLLRERDDGGQPACPFCALGAAVDLRVSAPYLPASHVEDAIHNGAVDNRERRAA